MKRLAILSATACALVGFGAAPLLAQQAATKPAVVPHALEGRTACLMCHKAGAMEAVPNVPANHEGRPNETCLWCHGKDAPVQTAAPKAIPHSLEGRNMCLMCHKPGAMAPVPDAPASHQGITEQYCQMCHKPAAK